MADAMQRPVPLEVILKELAALRVMTKSRSGSADDLDFTLTVYAERLRFLPGDIVLHVLRTQAERSPWWPAWQELHERLESLGGARRTFCDALDQLVPEVNQ